MSILERPVVPTAAAPVLVTDLLADADTIKGRLQEALSNAHWLDAYLFSAGLSQLLDDRLHADPFWLNRAAHFLGSQNSRLARLAGAMAKVAGKGVHICRTPGDRRLGRSGQPLAELTMRLAKHVIEGKHPGDLVPLLRAVLPVVPALAGDPMRMPSCFHSFDQHPDDVKWLAAEFGRRYPRRSMPLCVVGVRTSGSYLGPLLAVALKAAGYSAVSLSTYRPGQPFLRRERADLKAAAEAGGLVLVCDDPPGTGTSLAATGRDIRRAGVADSKIVFMLSLFGSADDVPAALSRWPVVAQPWNEWSVHGRLAAGPVREAFSALLGPGKIVSNVRQLRVSGPPASRGHVRARFAVRLTDPSTGDCADRHILVEGSGLGYLGREAVAVASALPGKVPHVYGHSDGLLYRDWLPAPTGSVASAGLAANIADYVAARRTALAAPHASTARLGGRDPDWEVAAKLVSGQYGQLAIPMRPLLLNPVMRRILNHEWPSVVDGNTDSRHWLPDAASPAGLRKVDFHQRTFGNLDLICYDPVFDLAGAAADPPHAGFEAELRSAFERATNDHVDGERWLLYRLAHLWRFGRANELDSYQVKRRSAEAVHDYLAGLYLRDLVPADGPLCVIDLDGVLECDRLGYPVTSPTGALALRALIVHGYRPVLASGRSISDVRSRCESFGLAGGVAEYGAALYVDGEVTDLRSQADRDLLEQVRSELASLAGVQIDPQYQYAVRVRGANGPLPPEVFARARALSGPGLLIIQGKNQTDVTTDAMDKGTGLTALISRLGAPKCALAVGDAPPDLPMLAEASIARAPRNSSLGHDGRRFRQSRGAYQFGLAESCAVLLGHHPGRCSTCAPPDFAARTRATLAILDLRANGLATIPARTAALGAFMLRKGPW